MQLSKFGTKFTARTGILELMDDLAHAFGGKERMYMLGGGNPAFIPEVQHIFKERMRKILEKPGEFERMIGNYDGSQGYIPFLESLTKFLNAKYKWGLSSENIAITSGSQEGFFILFNMFAGEFNKGKKKKILLPLAPEYIGYADQGISENLFVSFRSKIKYLDKHTFKYEINFSKVEKYVEKNKEKIAAICVSRPTNPTGNVISDNEVEFLSNLSKKNNLYLIIDNAYGEPFPNILFTKAKLIWNKNIILSMSLSKLGLPSTRTGIIIADREVIQAIKSINAILILASGSIGQIITYPLFKNARILRICDKYINPFYRKKSELALLYIKKYFDDSLPYYVHKSEGALFLWLWFKDFPITTKELYERLKKRKVIVVPGQYFFPGLKANWKHKHECIRITYSQNSEDVEMGIKIIGEEVRKAYKN